MSTPPAAVEIVPASDSLPAANNVQWLTQPHSKPIPANEEIELKLDLTLESADALAGARLFEGKSRVSHQFSTYFDTPEHSVWKKGYSLRIRQLGRKKVETVKADGGNAAGLFERTEWERKVTGDTPHLDDSTPLAALLGDEANHLTAIFSINVTRRTWQVNEGKAIIEVVLDRGKIVAGERETPICELELEQKCGCPSDLFALARKIAKVVPVRLGVLSKGERGYKLLAPAVTAAKSEKVALDPGMNSALAFQSIARACLQQFRQNEQLLLIRHEPEVLHQARVALRRLTSAFSIYKAMLSDSQFSRLRNELRWLSTELGTARDLDVLLDRSPPGRVHGLIEQARNEARAALDTALASDRARTLMIDLAEWISTGDWLQRPATEDLRNQSAREFATGALDRSRKKTMKGGRHFETIDDDARHRIRKSAKKLRYTAEFFADLYGRKRQKARRKRFIAALRDFQDQLGALNDLVTARRVLGRLGLSDELEFFAALLGTGQSEALLETAAGTYKKLGEAKRFWR
jgi:inorganic triphosphatase YgiF